MASALLTEDVLFRALAMHAAISAPLGGDVFSDAERYERSIRSWARGQTPPPGRSQRPAHLALVGR